MEMFVSLAEACKMADTKDVLNLMGIVTGVGLRRQTKSGKSDHMYTLQIVDTTYFHSPLSINFFAPKVEDLPYVKSFGDILVITGVKTTTPRGMYRPSISCSRKQFSYALCSRNPINGEIKPYYSCLSSGQFLDKELIQQFGFQSSALEFGPGDTHLVRKISDFADRIVIDLICKVLHVHKGTESNEWELLVWDGTNVPSTYKLETVQSYRARMQLPVNEIPNVGSILKVNVSCIAFDAHLVTGRYVKLYNVMCTVNSPDCYFKLSENSKIRFLSDVAATQYIRHCEERLLTPCTTSIVTNPSPLYLTDTDENSSSEEDEPQMSLVLHSDVQNLLDFANSSAVKKPIRRSAKQKKKPSKRQRISRKKQQNLFS